MIHQARKDLTNLLKAAGLHVYPFVPERIEAPCVILDTAPRIESGETYGSYSLSFKITAVVAPAGDFGIQVDNLDNLLDTLVETLRNQEMHAEGHFIMQLPDGQQMLAYDLIVSTEY